MYRRQQPNYSFSGTSQAPAAEPASQYSFPSSSSFSVTSYTPSYGNFPCRLQGSFPFSPSSATIGYNPSNLSLAAEPASQYSFPSSSSFSVTSYTPSYGNFPCRLQGSFPFSPSSATTGYNPSNLSLAAEPASQYSFPSSSSFSVTSYTPSYGNFPCTLQGSFPFSPSSAATGYNPSNLSFPRASSTRSEGLNAVDVVDLTFGAVRKVLELGIETSVTGFVDRFIPGIGVAFTVGGMEAVAAIYEDKNPSLSEDNYRIMNHPLLSEERKKDMEDKLFKKPASLEQPRTQTIMQFIKADPRHAGYVAVEAISSAVSLFSMGSTTYRSLRSPAPSPAPAIQPAAIEGHSGAKAVFNPELHSNHLDRLNKTFLGIAEDAAFRDFGEVPKKWVPGFRNFSERSSRRTTQVMEDSQNGRKSVPLLPQEIIKLQNAK